MNVENMSDELKAQALECKTGEEFLALAEEEGVTLSDEQLEALAAGAFGTDCTHFGGFW